MLPMTHHLIVKSCRRLHDRFIVFTAIVIRSDCPCSCSVYLRNYALTNEVAEGKESGTKPKMMTVCVGRLTIDVPEGSEVQFRSARFAGADVSVQTGYTEAQLHTDISQREKELAQEKNEYGQPSGEKMTTTEAINFSTTLLYFGRRKPVTMFEFGKPVMVAEEAISIQGYGIKDGVAFFLRAENLGSPRARIT